MAALTLMAGAAIAGLYRPAPVVVDVDTMIASGDQWTARTADNDLDFIGCGTLVVDNGVNPVFYWGFCQAGDSDENSITCFTTNTNLLDTMKATSDFSFISFSWQDDGGGGAECTRVRYSTQSVYLPNFKVNKDRRRSDGDSDSD